MAVRIFYYFRLFDARVRLPANLGIAPAKETSKNFIGAR
jgi:hypothetical protein